MESRIRLAIVLAGPSTPVSQLAYPEVRLGIEYNGSEHLRPDRALRDLEREQLLVRAGWRILRFRVATALHHPRTIAARMSAELARDQRALRHS